MFGLTQHRARPSYASLAFLPVIKFVAALRIVRNLGHSLPPRWQLLPSGHLRFAAQRRPNMSHPHLQGCSILAKKPNAFLILSQNELT
jgi:hypothetical protein